jgi:hypothetical protein
MQHEKLSQRGTDADHQQYQRAQSRRRRPQQQRRAANFEQAGQIAEPLTDADMVEHFDHGGEPSKLGAAKEQEQRRKHELQRPESDRLEAGGVEIAGNR